MEQDPDTTVEHELFPFARIYKSGRLERLLGTDTVPAGTDPTTGVISKDVPINPITGVSARLYLPSHVPSNTKLPILIYIHGGGFMIETAQSPTYHNFLNSLVSKTNILAISVDYRRAPEHPLPTAYDDCWDALLWATGDSSPDEWVSKYGDLGSIYLGGDSAGANAAHNVTVKSASEGIRIKGLLLCHPWFWGSKLIGTETAYPENHEKGSFIWKFIYPGMNGLDDPFINPIASEESMEKVFKCDKVLVAVAEKDALRDRGRLYYETLVKAIAGGKWGGEAVFSEAKEEDHVFYLLNSGCDKAAEIMDIIAKFID